MCTKKKIVQAIFIIFLIGLVAQILFDPLSIFLQFGENLEARLGLPSARKKWESQSISHYTFDIQGYVPLVCMFGGSIEVRNGVVIHTGPRSDARVTPGLMAIEDPPICNYQNYTVPLLFDELERWLSVSPLSVSQVSFDPEYGFITSFHFGSSDGQGLLNPIISDCCGGYSIENFQALGE